MESIDMLNKGLDFIHKSDFQNKDFRKIEILKELRLSYSRNGNFKKADSIFALADKLETEEQRKLNLKQLISLVSVSEEFSKKETLFYRRTIILIILLSLVILIGYFFIQRKNTKRQKRLNQKLEETNIAKQTFISVLAHQSKGRIDTLKNQVIVFRNQVYPNLQPRRKEDIDLIQEFTFRLSNTFHNLLVWARPTAGTELPMQQQKINLKNEFGNSSEFGREVKREAKIKDIKVIFDFPSEHNVYADKVFTTVILRNVLENATKYSKCKTINVSSTEKYKQINIIIKDDGIGIPKDKIREENFEFDAPLDNEKRASGFGLKISKKLARQQGGRFLITSKMNGGTMVTISFKKITKNE